MIRFIQWAIVLISVFPALQSGAKNYYISASGSDNNNGTSPQTSWKTLDKLNNSWGLIGPGDSVLFRRGDVFAPTSVGSRIGLLRIPNLKKGTAAAPITIGAYGTGDRPVISGEKCSEYHQALRTGALEHITVQDLEFRGAVVFRASDDLALGIRHFRLLRIKLKGGIDKGNETKISFTNPYAPSKVPQVNVAAPIDKVEIGYCEFYDTEGEDAVNIGSVGDSLWVHHNIWKNVSEEALDVAGGTGHLIEYNFVSGCSVNGLKFHSQFSNQHGIVIRGNVILRVGTGTPANALVIQNVSNSKIYNNTIASFYTGYIGNRDRTPPEAYYGDFTGNQIYNNIFLGTCQIQGSWINTDLGAGPWYSAPVFNMWSNNSFHHNIYWSPAGDSKVIRFWENGQYPNITATVNNSRTVNNNNQAKFISEWQSKSSVTELMADPILINPIWTDSYTYGNFTPQPNSPAINGGVATSGYTHDINGTLVPESGKITIGAYQVTFTSTGQRSAPGKNLRYYPNPFRVKTEIRVYLDRTEHVNLFIHDLSGKIIRTLVRNTLPAGTSSVTWNGMNDAGEPCPGGMYLCCLVAGDEVNTGKLMLLR